MSHVPVGQVENTNSVMDRSLSPDKYKDIDVSVGIVANSRGQLLIAKRPEHWMGGGFWEFPGGKIEPGEDAEGALKRELVEEVGIIVEQCTPLLKLTYVYPERQVRLNAYIVNSYRGEAAGLEGQEISWCSPFELNSINMLPANKAIVTATQLPDTYLITPECHDPAIFLPQLNEVLQAGKIKLMLLRSKNLTRSDYLRLAKEVASLCEQHKIFLLLSQPDFSIAQEVKCKGMHLTSEQMLSLSARPLPQERWLSASCHNEEQVAKANALGLDFITISPIHPSYKSESSLGWEGFERLTTKANLPVFALGGLSLEDIPTAKHAGGQGIAAIRTLWVNAYSSVS